MQIEKFNTVPEFVQLFNFSIQFTSNKTVHLTDVTYNENYIVSDDKILIINKHYACYMAHNILINIDIENLAITYQDRVISMTLQQLQKIVSKMRAHYTIADYTFDYIFFGIHINNLSINPHKNFAYKLFANNKDYKFERDYDFRLVTPEFTHIRSYNKENSIYVNKIKFTNISKALTYFSKIVYYNEHVVNINIVHNINQDEKILLYFVFELGFLLKLTIYYQTHAYTTIVVFKFKLIDDIVLANIYIKEIIYHPTYKSNINKNTNYVLLKKKISYDKYKYIDNIIIDTKFDTLIDVLDLFFKYYPVPTNQQ